MTRTQENQAYDLCDQIKATCALINKQLDEAAEIIREAIDRANDITVWTVGDCDGCQARDVSVTAAGPNGSYDLCRKCMEGQP